MKITEEQLIRWKSTGATTVRCFEGSFGNIKDLPCNDQLVGMEVLDAWPLLYFKKELVAGRSADEVKKVIREFVQQHKDMLEDYTFEDMIYYALSGNIEGRMYDAYDFMSEEYINSSEQEGDDGFIDMFYTDLAVAILGYDPENLTWGSEEWKKVDALSFELIDLEDEFQDPEDEDYDDE